MKNRNNAFTLIELLAVIVILAIIALIATPIVINIIDEAKRNSFVQTVNGIIDAAEYYYANEMLTGEKLKENVIFTFPNEIEGLEFDGEVPKSGAMIITSEGEIALSMGNGKYCVKKMYDGDLTIIESSECVLSILSVLATITEEVTEINECVKKGRICTNGTNETEPTIFAIQVNEHDVYNFYVIEDNGREITLIMDRNLGNRIAWYAESLDNTKGPLTALNELRENTFNWINIPERSYIYIDDGGKNKYSIKEPFIMRARMLTYTETLLLGCTENAESCPGYLYTNLSSSNTHEQPFGYWTSSASSFMNAAWYINYKGNLNNRYTVNSEHYGVVVDRNCGVRPVITISK